MSHQIDKLHTYINNTEKGRRGNKLFILKSLINSSFPKRTLAILILVFNCSAISFYHRSDYICL